MQAPDCNDCQKDHHTLICLEEKKEQKVFKSEEEDDDSYVSDDKEAAKLWNHTSPKLMETMMSIIPMLETRT